VETKKIKVMAKGFKAAVAVIMHSLVLSISPMLWHCRCSVRMCWRRSTSS
jgi:hypothetical protein